MYFNKQLIKDDILYSIRYLGAIIGLIIFAFWVVSFCGLLVAAEVYSSAPWVSYTIIIFDISILFYIIYNRYFTIRNKWY